MTLYDKLSNLRGGVVYGAANVPPTTARNWSIDLGVKTDGHPRYNVVDAARLMLMSTLVHEYRMSGEMAARIVNALRETLDDQARGMIAQLQLSGTYDRGPGVIAVVTRTPEAGLPVTDFLSLQSEASIGTLLGHNPNVMIVIPLGPIINRAIYRLERVLAGELAEREDEA